MLPRTRVVGDRERGTAEQRSGLGEGQGRIAEHGHGAS